MCRIEMDGPGFHPSPSSCTRWLTTANAIPRADFSTTCVVGNLLSSGGATEFAHDLTKLHPSQPPAAVPTPANGSPNEIH